MIMVVCESLSCDDVVLLGRNGEFHGFEEIVSLWSCLSGVVEGAVTDMSDVVLIPSEGL